MKKHSLTIKLLSVLVICGLLFAAAPVDQVQATSLCVNTDGSGGCYTTIQAAINAAAVGDTINVAAGKYVENVNINKTISLIGADATTTSIVGTTGMKTPLTFAANNITVNGFTHTYTQPAINKTFSDIVIVPGVTTQLTVKVFNENPFGLVDIAYTDVMPPNIVFRHEKGSL